MLDMIAFLDSCESGLSFDTLISMVVLVASFGMPARISMLGFRAQHGQLAQW